MTTVRRFVAGVSALVLLAGCGGGAEEEARTTPSGTPATTETWQLVWFSDSGAWSVSDRWADRIEEVEGVEVEVFEHIGYGATGSADSVLWTVLNDQEVRDQLATAEVVVVYASNYDQPPDVQEACLDGTSARPPDPVPERLLDRFRTKLTAIFDEVLALRDGESTIVRSLDLYVPVVARWRASGVMEECTRGWEATAAVQREVAEEHDVPLVSLYDAFNGPEHLQDPVPRGLIGPDGIHTSAKGQRLILALLDDAGYQPLRP